MKSLIIVTLQHFKRLQKDKTAIVWMLIVPVVYMYIFGHAFQRNQDPRDARGYLAVLNHDKGKYALRLVQNLKSENLNINQLDSLPAEPLLRTLVIPDSFSAKLKARQKVALTLRLKPSADHEATTTVTLAVQKARWRLMADMAETALNDSLNQTEVWQNIDNSRPRITLKSEWAGTHRVIPSGFSHQTPGTIVMFTMLVMFIYGGIMVLSERQSGTLRRLLVSPLTFWQLFGGKIVGLLFIALVQIVALLLVGRLVFDVYYGHSVIGMTLLVLFFALTIGTLALCLGFLVDEEDKLVGISITLAILLAALGGCWFPMEIAPGWMQTLSFFLPSGLAMAGFHRLMAYGYGLQEILPYLGGLALYSIAALMTSRLLLRKIFRV
ncbi:ABC transporter permease subunit [candidate division KSB1 bacterium]|nr:ABC transporter permease subunit [candidate division KSB1 bacterium]